MKNFKVLLILSMVAALSAVSPADWTVLENFDDYDNGDAATVTEGVWSSETDDSSVNIAASDDHGNVLYIYKDAGSNNWDGSYRDIGGTDAAVVVDEVQTYFYQVRVWSDWDTSSWVYDIMLGLTQETSSIGQIDAWQDFSVMPYINNAPATPYINASGTDPHWQLMTPEVWTNVWVVIHNDATNPYYDYYISTSPEETPLHGNAAGVAVWRNDQAGTDLNAIGYMASGWDLTHYQIDNICYAEGEDLTYPSSFSNYGPTDPVVTPDNGDGTVGNIVETSPGVWEIQDVTLNFVAAGDPNKENDPQMKINPDIVAHNIYLQTGAPDDPNLYLYDSVIETITDPYTHDPNVTYGPLPDGLLEQAAVVKWQVEEVLDDGFSGYPAGDPNNVMGPVWSFTTASATPSIVSISYHQLTDGNGDASLTMVTGTIADNYRWYKVVSEQDSDENGETDDVQLVDGGLYSGTQTKTLAIAGMAANGSDDARYYAVAYNGDPDTDGIASLPSVVKWVWYPRETSRYTFEATYNADGNSFVEDTISGYDMQLLSDDGTTDLPSIDPNHPDAPGLAGSNSLFFNNPNTNDDPNNADGQYAEIEYDWVGGYKDITISAWIYHKAGGGWQRILGFGDTETGTGATNYTYMTPNANNNSGQLMFNVRGQNVTAPAGSVPENEWAYVTATLSGDTGKLYVNGEWVATNDGFTNDPVDNGRTPNNWIARSQWYNWDSLYNGSIADLRIWNYGRTNEEIAGDYISDTGAEYVCDFENYDIGDYDLNDDCLVNLSDVAIFIDTWLDHDRIYAE